MNKTIVLQYNEWIRELQINEEQEDELWICFMEMILYLILFFILFYLIESDVE